MSSPSIQRENWSYITLIQEQDTQQNQGGGTPLSSQDPCHCTGVRQDSQTGNRQREQIQDGFEGYSSIGIDEESNLKCMEF